MPAFNPIRRHHLCRTDRARFVRIASLFCFLVMLCVGLSYASAPAQDELAVKAAFVFNLTKYVEWPHPGPQSLI
jgi:hypothetical protein